MLVGSSSRNEYECMILLVVWVTARDDSRLGKITFLDACTEIGQLLEFGEFRWIRGIRESCEEFFFKLLRNSRILEDMVCCNS